MRPKRGTATHIELHDLCVTVGLSLGVHETLVRATKLLSVLCSTQIYYGIL